MSLKLYFLTLVIFLGIDAFWLGLVAPRFYRSQIGHLMADKAILSAALIFYLLYMVGLVFFVVAPGMSMSTREVILRGALFGLVAYATYDLTNLATLRDWPVFVTVVDLVWGTFLTAATSAVAVWLAGVLGF
jgi:uncharacterized membrane protein